MGGRSEPRRALRLGAGAPSGDAHRPEQVAVEEPLRIVVGGDVVATTMRTPGHDVELALGWLVAEGVARRQADVVGVRAADGTVEVALADAVEPPARRLAVTVSACGVCGVEDLDGLHARLPHVSHGASADDGPRLDPAVLLSLPERLRAAQPLFDRTGGLHAAGWCAPDGEVLLVREDVGRHNALDKLVGALWLREDLPARDGVLCLSGRASYELVLKAAMAGMRAVVAVSAPSTAAVDLARDAGVTLVAFVRGGGGNVYSGEARIVPPAPRLTVVG